MKKENTLAAKTDALTNTHDAQTPEAKADDWGATALNKRKRGGKVDGAKPRHSMGRPGRARGGKVSKGTKVNVIVMPQGGAGAMPPPAAMAGPGPAGPPIVAPPRPLPAAAPAAMPPAGAAPPPMMPRAKGGRVHMTAGALSGEGRLEKIKEYGKNAKSGEGKAV